MAYGQNMKAPSSGIASLMAMRGRKGDNTLVHVNPMELRALNSMAPGGLSQNPATGLPEAFKLKDILPALGAVAGGVLLAPLLGLGGGALAAGVGTGVGAAAGTAAAGGNRKEILGSGLLSGFTAGLGAKAAGLGKAGEAATGTGLEKVVKTPGTTTVTSGKLIPAPESLGTSIGETLPSGARLYQPASVPPNVYTPPTIAEKIGGFGDMYQRAGGLKGIVGTSLAASAPMLAGEQPKEQESGLVQSVKTGQKQVTATPEEIDEYIRKGGVLPTFFQNNPNVITPGIYKEGGGEIQTPTADGNTVKGNSYVIDAFDVAALGNGNTMAGADIIMNALGKSNDDSFSGLVVTDNSGVADDVSFNVQDGGDITKANISGGEVILAPDQVERAGGTENIDEFRKELTQRVYKGEPSKVDSKFLQKLA